MAKVCPLPNYGSVVRWTVQDVINWLSENKLQDCMKKFREASVDGNKLLNITSSDLRQIQVNKTDGRRVLELVDQVQRPNERRGQGGYNSHQNNANSRTVQADQDSDSDQDWGSDFSNDEDGFDMPVAQPRTKQGGGRLPPPPAKSSPVPSGPPKPSRQPVPAPVEEEYEDPYKSRYPGPENPADPYPEDTYDDPDQVAPKPPVPRQTNNFSRPAAKPPQDLPRSQPAPPIPQRFDEPQEIYTEVDDESQAPPSKPPPPRGRAPSPHRGRAPSPPPPARRGPAPSPQLPNRGPAPSPQMEDYEDITEEDSNSQASQSAPKPLSKLPPPGEEVYEAVDEPEIPCPRAPVPLPPRQGQVTKPPGRGPAQLPPTPAAPGEEVYEAVDEPESQSPVNRQPNRAPAQLPPRQGQVIKSPGRGPVQLPPTPAAPGEDVYEDVDEKDQKTTTAPKPPPPRQGKQTPAKAPAQKKVTPPSRTNLPPTPAVPEDVYEIEPVVQQDEEDNYLDMDDSGLDTAPPLPNRPGGPDEDDNYLEMEEQVLPSKLGHRAPPPRQQIPLPSLPDTEEDYVQPTEAIKPPEPVRSRPAPPIPSNEPPKPVQQKQPAVKRDLPKPPVPGYTQVVVGNHGQPVRVEDDRGVAGPNLNEYLEGLKFYHGEITRAEGEAKLLAHRVDGMYLIRKSTKNADQPYTLQMFYDGETFNLPIYKNKNNNYIISNENTKDFSTIREMVNHFKLNNLILKGKRETLLKRSVPKS